MSAVAVCSEDRWQVLQRRARGRRKKGRYGCGQMWAYVQRAVSSSLPRHAGLAHVHKQASCLQLCKNDLSLPLVGDGSGDGDGDDNAGLRPESNEPFIAAALQQCP